MISLAPDYSLPDPERARDGMLPAISLYNPWAMWVALGWKTIETRLHDRFQSLKGLHILIHAGLSWDVRAIQEAKPYLTKEQIQETTLNLKTWPRGAFVCNTLVHDYRLTEPEDAKAALIECQTPRVGLYLRDTTIMEPVDAVGRQGIWWVDPSDFV